MKMTFEDRACAWIKGCLYIKKDCILQILLQAKKEELSYDCLIDAIIDMKTYK